MRLSGWYVPFDQLSASSIALLIQCPEQFRLRKIKKLPETFGIDRFVGVVDHVVHAENFIQKIDTATDLTAAMMDGTYDRQWNRTILEEGEPDWQGDTADGTRELGKQMVSLYHEKVSPQIQPIRVEQRFEERLKGVPVPIVGYPDVETSQRIVERKTTKTKLSKPKTKWVMQGRIYSMVLDKPVEYQVVTKQKTPQVVTSIEAPEMLLQPEHHDSTAELIRNAAYMLNDYWVRFGPDQPWPTMGIYHDWLCNFCSFGPKYGGQCVAWSGRKDHA